jgi:hypothetical protein
LRCSTDEAVEQSNGYTTRGSGDGGGKGANRGERPEGTRGPGTGRSSRVTGSDCAGARNARTESRPRGRGARGMARDLGGAIQRPRFERRSTSLPWEELPARAAWHVTRRCQWPLNFPRFPEKRRESARNGARALIARVFSDQPINWCRVPCGQVTGGQIERHVYQSVFADFCCNYVGRKPVGKHVLDARQTGIRRGSESLQDWHLGTSWID